MNRRVRPTFDGSRAWPTLLGVLVSITAVGLGLRFGVAGLAATIAIGLFALFASAAIISGRGGSQQAIAPPEEPPLDAAGPGDPRAAPRF